MINLEEPKRVGSCLRWQGAHNANGYGTYRRKYVHRLAWEAEHGPIPEGMTIDHVAARGCEFKDCVNVEHLEMVTRAENIRRSPRTLAQIARTHCPEGHPYEGHNLIVRRGKRECRTCVYARNRAARRIRRANGKRH